MTTSDTPRTCATRRTIAVCSVGGTWRALSIKGARRGNSPSLWDPMVRSLDTGMVSDATVKLTTSALGAVSGVCADPADFWNKPLQYPRIATIEIYLTRFFNLAVKIWLKLLSWFNYVLCNTYQCFCYSDSDRTVNYNYSSSADLMAFRQGSETAFDSSYSSTNPFASQTYAGAKQVWQLPTSCPNT